MSVDHSVFAALVDLVQELSSELDLHHSDDEMPSLHRTMDVLFGAVALLEKNNVALPEPFLHLRDRFQRKARVGR